MIIAANSFPLTSEPSDDNELKALITSATAPTETRIAEPAANTFATGNDAIGIIIEMI